MCNQSQRCRGFIPRASPHTRSFRSGFVAASSLSGILLRWVRTDGLDAMQLYYFKDRHGNFGDDLNPWLWGQLLPEVLRGPSDELFVGIGTLLNHRLPAAPIKHVFGSGHGYGGFTRFVASRLHALLGCRAIR